MDARFREIQQIMLDKKAEASQLNAFDVLTDSEITLSGADSTSKVSNWRLFFWIFSFALWVMEKTLYANSIKSRPMNTPNFIEMALGYIDGVPMIWKNKQFRFDTTGLSNQEIIDRQVVKKCVALTTRRGILVKITGVNGVPVTNDQATSFYRYIDKNLGPGHNITLYNKIPDNVKAVIDVYVDPLLIELSTGKLKNTSSEVRPAEDAARQYLENLEFNGAFVRNKFEDEIQKAIGVKLTNIQLLQSKYESLPFSDIGIYKIANSGHYQFAPGDLTINYLSYGSLE